VCVSVDCGVSDLVELCDVLRNFYVLVQRCKSVSVCLSICLSFSVSVRERVCLLTVV